MSLLSSQLKIKVCTGEGENEIIKRLSQFPSSFDDLYEKTLKRLAERFNNQEEKIYIYYNDDYNGMIQIEDDNDLRGAVESCNLLSLKYLKLYVYSYRLERIERSRIIHNPDYNPDENIQSEQESKEESDEEDSDGINSNNQKLEESNQNYDSKINHLVQDAHSEDEDEDGIKNLSQSDDSDSDDQNVEIKFINNVKHSQNEEERYEDNKKEDAHNKNPNHVDNNDNEEEEDLFYTCLIGPPASREKVLENKLRKDFENMDVFGNKIEENQQFEFDHNKQKEFALGNQYEEDKENRKVEEDIYRSNHVLEEQELARKERQCVYRTSHCLLLPINVKDQLPKISNFSYFTSAIKSSIVGISEEQADELMRVDDRMIDNSNCDVILAKPGSLVKKTWRVKNLGTRSWPTDTKIVSVTDSLFYHAPSITHNLAPGEVMEIGIRIYVPNEESDYDTVKEYI